MRSTSEDAQYEGGCAVRIRHIFSTNEDMSVLNVFE